MSKKMIPCRVCGSCGLYHDISVETCACGADLRAIPFTVTDYSAITRDRSGTINPNLSIFVQKCSNCGAENFTNDPVRPVTVCCSCGRKRIASVDPIPYNGGQGDAPEQPVAAPAAGEGTPLSFASAEPQHEQVTLDSDAVDRVVGILGGVSSALGGTPTPTPPTPPQTLAPASVSGTSDDEEEAPFSWGAVVPGIQTGGSSPVPAPVPAPAPAPASAQTKAGTLARFSAICYGTFSAELRADQMDIPLLVGRYAAWGNFVDQDPRVSGEHCYISWYVRDDSTNGTMINRTLLRRGDEHVLQDGDTLTLGHSENSMAFRVSIGE